MMNQLLSSVSKTNIKNPENVTLTLEGTTIHSLKELREHFNHDEILETFMNDTLLLWLLQHYYEAEAEQLRTIDSGDKNCFRKICRVFRVNYMDHISLTEEERKQLDQKKEIVKKVIADTKAEEKLLEKLPFIATNQEELAGLIDSEEQKIYLCNESFSIPISKPGIEYIGIGDVSIENPFTPEQYRRAGITMTNISLPVTENPETADAARVAAAANGYDSFHESHSALATLFHNQLKTYRIYEHYHLSFDASVMGTFFNSRTECASAKKTALEKAYNEARRYVSPGDSKCITKAAAEHYTRQIHDVFTPEVLENLQKLCEIRRKTPLFQKLQEQIKQSKKTLSSLLEAELHENADFYAMYQFDYFMDQVEIEEHDYRISEGGFLRALETLAGGSIQYTITDIHSAISEMEEDINDHANTFFNTAQSEYQYYCQDIEELIQEIGSDFSEQKENESVSDYLQRLCSEGIR